MRCSCRRTAGSARPGGSGPVPSSRPKGHEFSAAALLADEQAAAPFRDGSFATIYLSPRDYHRVHMPWGGRLRETVHVPGRLFSVAPFTVDAIPGLFARNERLVCHFDTSFGPMAVVMVAAMLVSGIQTVWSGVEVPPYARRIFRKDHRSAGVELARGAEMARFLMGSTVVVLVPRGSSLLRGWTPLRRSGWASAWPRSNRLLAERASPGASGSLLAHLCEVPHTWALTQCVSL
jgi:phosphatidylserine decarboxylase